jgi:putative hydrolase of the HAD superfamily
MATYKVSDFQAVIFDLGAVLLNINYQDTIDAFKALGIKNFDDIFSKAKQSSLTDDFEKGVISEIAFFDSLKKLLNTDVPRAELVAAWNIMLKDLPSKRVEMLKKCQTILPTFLLSNTNYTHIQDYHAYLEKNFSVPDMKTWFTKVYYSFEMGKRKPDANIFEQVLNENNLQPEKVLYIDDSPQHIESARKLGVVSHHLLDCEDVCDILLMK